MTLDLFERGPRSNEWFLDIDDSGVVDGLTLVEGYDPNGRAPEEVAIMEKARLYQAHSVFFEASRNGRPPVPQAFVYISQDGSDGEAFADLHKRLWSWGGVPLLYRRTPGQIQLFLAFSSSKRTSVSCFTGEAKMNGRIRVSMSFALF